MINCNGGYMKRIAVFSDIHGNLEALESILKDINSKNYDEIVFVGDVLSIGPSSKECLELLKRNNVRFILGNHELYYLRGSQIDSNIDEDGEKQHYEWVKSLLDETDREYLNKCPLFYEEEGVLFAHFIIGDIDFQYPFARADFTKNVNGWQRYKDKYKLVLLGHEHRNIDQNELSLNGETNIFLLGSSGCTNDDNTFYTSLELGEEISVTRVYIPYDREKFVLKLKSIDYPDKKMIAKHFFGIEDCKTI